MKTGLLIRSRTIAQYLHFALAATATVHIGIIVE